jgi:hypothetical protein
LDDLPLKQVKATAGKENITLTYTFKSNEVIITFAQPILLQRDKYLKIIVE